MKYSECDNCGREDQTAREINVHGNKVSLCISCLKQEVYRAKQSHIPYKRRK